MCWNLDVQSPASRGFFEAAQEIYWSEAPELTRDYRPLLQPDEVPAEKVDEIERTGLFGEVTVRRYPWDATYDAASYLRLLNTYSGPIHLESGTRERLFRGIAELIDTQFHGRITKGYLAILYVAHRK